MHAARSLGAALLALAVTTLSAIPREVTAAEEWLFDRINGLPGILEWPLQVVMQLGAALAIPALALLAFAICRRLRPGLDLVVAGTVAWVCAKVMKGLLERGRPASFFDDVNLRGSLGADNMDGLGFPSGHVTMAFAVAAVLYPYLTPRWRVVTMVLATTVALTGLYFGAHFPLDALGGAALGIAIGATVHLVMDRVTHHHQMHWPGRRSSVSAEGVEDGAPSGMPSPSPPPTRLARRLNTSDAVVIGLASMIGAGVFAAIGPAAQAAGSGLVVGLALAAIIAYCNATSSAQLAAVHPESGGTYVYGRERLGRFWGYLAGWGFVVGKTASCAAMALTFGAYASPSLRRPLAVGAVVAITAVNYQGVRKTAWLTGAVVAVVLASLGAVVVAAVGGGTASVERLGPLGAGGVGGILKAAGLLFFAFAGYARIATLGEEVIDPSRTIPWAVPLALDITLAVYAAVAVSALLAVGPGQLAESTAPLATATRAGSLDWLSPAVRVGGTVAALGMLLSLMAGVSRRAFAMAAAGDLPRRLDAVHRTHRVPHRAELAVGVAVAGLVLVTDLRGAIGFSSFAVLSYYAITNAAAWTLPADQRRWPRWLATAGAAGCAVLAVTLPPASVVAGMAVLGLGAGIWAVREGLARRGQSPAR